MRILRSDLPALPQRMNALPVDERGYPVPWFVAYIDGKPDFRAIRPGGINSAINRRTCWLCGQPLGVKMVFVIGPMCAVNRVTSEPPSHRDCAEFAVQACPFLTHPMAKRNEHDLPVHGKQPAGIHLDRNPGATCLWSTRSFTRFNAPGGMLIELGPPESVSWWAHGREATREEVLTSVDTGMPHLLALAQKEGRDSVAALDRQYREFLPMLPMEASR
jgi:ferredoxin